MQLFVLCFLHTVSVLCCMLLIIARPYTTHIHFLTSFYNTFYLKHLRIGFVTVHIKCRPAHRISLHANLHRAIFLFELFEAIETEYYRTSVCKRLRALPSFIPYRIK